MSKLNLDKIKDSLIAERESLLAKLSGNDLSVDASETPDPVDLAVRNYSKNVMLAVSENESRQVVLINEALERIAGQCAAMQKDGTILTSAEKRTKLQCLNIRFCAHSGPSDDADARGGGFRGARAHRIKLALQEFWSLPPGLAERS